MGREIVVINLMRFGDLIQCSPVFRGLRREYPDACLSLLVQDLFADTAGLLPEVDRLLPFPSVVLSSLVDEEGWWAKGLTFLQSWLKENFPRPPALVINLTPTLVGAILAFLLKGRESRGILVNGHRSLITRPGWATYTLIISRAREANPFNLVDLFRREAGLRADGPGLAVSVPQAAEEEAEGLFRELPLSPRQYLIGLMPGASRPERCWPPENFAQAMRILSARKPCHFFIFGSAKEASLGETIARELPPGQVSLLAGRTPPPLLAACLKRLHLLITNDTGPMHLAAAVDIPTLALFLASARVHDTGPAGQGHIVLEPQMGCHPCLAPCPIWRCHQAIRPETVAWLAELMLDPESPEVPNRGGELLSGVRTYQAGRDPEGYQTFLPLTRRPLERRDCWLWLHRLLWGKVLDGAEPSGLWRRWLAETVRTSFLPPQEDLKLGATEAHFEELRQTAREGELLAAWILAHQEDLQAFPGRLWQQVKALKRVEETLHRLAAAFPELRSPVEFFFQMQRDSEKEEISALSQKLRESYALLRTLAEAGLEGLRFLQQIFSTSWGEQNLGSWHSPCIRL